MSNTEISILTQTHVAVAIYKSRIEADVAIEELEHSGFDLEKLSIIDHHGGGSCDRWGHQFNWLHSIGIPPFRILQYETALNVDKSIIITQWTAEEVVSGREKINRTNPETVEEHRVSIAAAEGQ